MKRLRYEWDDEIWLLHLEANNTGQDDKFLVYSRVIRNNGTVDMESKETVVIKPGESRRFIISRKDINEIALEVAFNENLLMKIFRLQDRAYLPSNLDIFYFNGDNVSNLGLI